MEIPMASAYYTANGEVKCPVAVLGSFLAHNANTSIIRAFYGADLVLGNSQLEKPLIAQAARLARVSQSYVFFAIQRQGEKADILSGRLPLIPTKKNGNGQSLPQAVIDDNDVANFIRSVGIDRILETVATTETAA
jgi:hypothetical protein